MSSDPRTRNLLTAGFPWGNPAYDEEDLAHKASSSPPGLSPLVYIVDQLKRNYFEKCIKFEYKRNDVLKCIASAGLDQGPTDLRPYECEFSLCVAYGDFSANAADLERSHRLMVMMNWLGFDIKDAIHNIINKTAQLRAAGYPEDVVRIVRSMLMPKTIAEFASLCNTTQKNINRLVLTF